VICYPFGAEPARVELGSLSVHTVDWLEGEWCGSSASNLPAAYGVRSIARHRIDALGPAQLADTKSRLRTRNSPCLRRLSGLNSQSPNCSAEAHGALNPAKPCNWRRWGIRWCCSFSRCALLNAPAGSFSRDIDELNLVLRECHAECARMRFGEE